MSRQLLRSLLLVIAVAVGVRLASLLIEPLLPMLIVLAALIALVWFIFAGPRHQ